MKTAAATPSSGSQEDRPNEALGKQLHTVQVFPSELGWQAIVGWQQQLVRLTFGHADPQEAWQAVSASSSGGVEASDWNCELAAQLQAFAAGEVVDFRGVALADEGSTPFQQEVLRACRAIPYGETLTYGQLAAAAGSPRAARAVGNAMACNCTPLVVPCHRVIPGGSRRPGAYSAGEGVRTKLRLLEMEALSAGKPSWARKPR
mgnify:CR=1 FL=1